MLLEVKNLRVCYDTATILNGVNLQVNQGELVSVVGPNGAGKTTMLRAITGLVRWERDTLRGSKYGNITIEGTVAFRGERIEHLPAHEISRRGLILCPERRRPFREMSVLDNLRAGAYLLKDGQEFKVNLEKIYSFFPVLKEREKQVSGTLSGGEQQMLAIGRSLMFRPQLLCIDEPSTGLAPLIRKELFTRIKEIQISGIPILLVEQDVSSAFRLSSRNYVLSQGKVVASGSSELLLQDETIRKTYLGL
ncbi:MAG: ABC transporter ATP-binding protein [Thermodesulfobacteriota bacterium]